MSESVLQQVSEALEEPLHVAIHELVDGGIEVVAVRQESQWADAFPLPMELLSAAGEAGVLLDTSTVARVELAQFPDDFWDDLTESRFGEYLTITVLGRSARKYLAIYRAVRTETTDHLQAESWTEPELARVAKWLREEQLFDHRSGPAIMAALDAGPDRV
jgi:hypothetical protein